jgi:O-antigen/teichoic acid export membrane protein
VTGVFQTRFSIARRFLVTAGANIFLGLCALCVTIVLARGMPAAEFGRYCFLVATFTATVQLLDTGMMQAFFTFASAREPLRPLLWVYGGWLGAIFACLTILILILPDVVLASLWPAFSRGDLLLGFTAVFLSTGVWAALIQLGESQRESVRVQLFRLGLGAVNLLLLLTLLFAAKLSITAVFWVTLVEYGLCALVFARTLPISHAGWSDDGELRPSVSKALLRRFGAYCLPLAPHIWIGAFCTFADRWMVQTEGDSSQQAFLQAATTLANISLLLTASLMNIFWKEISEAHVTGDAARMEDLFHRSMRLLFLGAAVMSGFLCMWSSEITGLVFGPEYEGATPVVMFMALYPLTQVVGQLSGTMMCATRQVRPYALIGVATLVAGLPVSYVLVKSQTVLLPGFGLGALGLVVKMLAIGLLHSLVMYYWVIREHGWQSCIKNLKAVLFLVFISAALSRALQPLLAEVVPESILLTFAAIVYLGMLGSGLFCGQHLTGIPAAAYLRQAVSQR